MVYQIIAFYNVTFILYEFFKNRNTKRALSLLDDIFLGGGGRKGQKLIKLNH